MKSIVTQLITQVFPTAKVKFGSFMNMQEVLVILGCGEKDLVWRRVWHKDTLIPEIVDMTHRIVHEMASELMKHPELKIYVSSITRSQLPRLSDPPEREPQITFDVPSQRLWQYPAYQCSWSW